MTKAPPNTPQPIIMSDIMDMAARADTLAWQAFRDGVDLFQIYGVMGDEGPSACKRPRISI